MLPELLEFADQPFTEQLPRLDAAGRPAIGYFCPYLPPELIDAAGAHPWRMRAPGSMDSGAGDALLSGRLCTYIRHVGARALEGDLDGLAGVICLNTCDHVRRIADLFSHKTDIGFQTFLSVPRAPREDLFGAYRAELERIYSELCAHLGTEPSPERIDRSIERYSRVRSRLARIRALQRQPDSPLDGASALALHILAQQWPLDDWLEYVDTRLADLTRAEPLPPPRARLMLYGAELDDVRYLRAIESTGARVVADRLCWGARALAPEIESQTDDPLTALARAYFFRPSCARMMGDFPRRYALLHEDARQAQAQGIVFVRMMFCDPWGAEQHNLIHRDGDPDALPLLTLTREYGVVPTGQLRTRVQAFVEKLEIARARQPAAEVPA